MTITQLDDTTNNNKNIYKHIKNREVEQEIQIKNKKVKLKAKGKKHANLKHKDEPLPESLDTTNTGKLPLISFEKKKQRPHNSTSPKKLPALSKKNKQTLKKSNYRNSTDQLSNINTILDREKSKSWSSKIDKKKIHKSNENLSKSKATKVKFKSEPSLNLLKETQKGNTKNILEMEEKFGCIKDKTFIIESSRPLGRKALLTAKTKELHKDHQEEGFDNNEQSGTSGGKHILEVLSSPRKMEGELSPRKKDKRRNMNKSNEKKQNKNLKQKKSSEKENNLVLLNLDETFTKDKTGNKIFAGRKSITSIVSEFSNASSILNSSINSESFDNLDIGDSGIEEISNDLNDDHSKESLIKKRIEENLFLNSLCCSDAWFQENIESAMVAFGTKINISTRTQAMVWVVLTRLGYYWTKNNKDPPTEKKLLEDSETRTFIENICKLCFNLKQADKLLVSAVLDIEIVAEKSRLLLCFKEFDIILPKLRLTNFDIVVFHEKGPYTNEIGNVVECNFFDKHLINFLASVHLHLSGEEVSEVSKDDILQMLPYLCGISSNVKNGEQRIVNLFVTEVASNFLDQDPELYVRFTKELWMDSLSIFLHCVYEGRLKKIKIRPPDNENEIFIVETDLAIHDVIALAYYLDKVDYRRVHITGLGIQDCNLTDKSLDVLANKVEYHMFRIIDR